MELSDRSIFHRWKLDGVLPRQLLKWSAIVLAAAAVAGGALYWSSIPQRALTSYNEATRLYEAGKYANALYQVNESMLDRGIRLKSFKLRANIYRSMLEPKNAVADITKVIELEPNVAAHYLFRAEANMEAQEPDRAVEDFSKLIELQRTAPAYHSRGRAYMKLKNPAKAVEDFGQAIALDPRNDYYLERGLAYASMDDHPKALENFDKAVELSSDEPWNAIYSLRARATERVKVGQIGPAQNDLVRALRIETGFRIASSEPGGKDVAAAKEPMLTDDEPAAKDDSKKPQVKKTGITKGGRKSKKH